MSRGCRRPARRRDHTRAASQSSPVTCPSTATRPGSTGAVTGSSWSADIGPSTGTIEIWDIDTGMPPPTLADAIAGAYGARFVPGERTLAVERDGVIEFVDVDSGIVERTLVPPADDTLFEFSPDGRSLVFPHQDGEEFHVLRLDSDAPPATFPHVSPINALFSPDSRSVAIGGNTDAVTVLDLESGRSVELAGHGGGGSPVLLRVRRPAGDGGPRWHHGVEHGAGGCRRARQPPDGGDVVVRLAARCRRHDHRPPCQRPGGGDGGFDRPEHGRQPTGRPILERQLRRCRRLP